MASYTATSYLDKNIILTDTNFEICDAGDLIRLEPIQVYDDNSQLDWDRNWVRTKVTVKGGAFSGEFTADLMTTDFELFKRDLINLDKDFKGTAKMNYLAAKLTRYQNSLSCCL